MPQIYQDPKAIEQIRGILQRENPNSTLLVRGNKSYETSGAKCAIEPQLSGYEVTHISGFSKSLTLKDVKKAVDAVNDKKIDLIIAVGGGTVLDVAKAASMLCGEDIVPCIKGEQKPKCRSIKLILIPTTAGTGAEITPFAVVYIDKIKFSFSHKEMIPDYVILAPELTYNLIPRVTAQTGCDALAQAIEGFWSVNATEESRGYSREAIKLVLGSLVGAVNDPNHENRKAMLIGSHLAGK